MLMKDLQKKSEAELRKMLAEEQQKLYDLRLKVSVNQLKEVRQIRQTRAAIARMKTQLSALKNQSQT